MKKAVVIVDLQFGSTGKGLIAGKIAKEMRPEVIVTAFSPNAGHTFIDSQGRKFVHTMIPNGIVADPSVCLIGPGSVINVDNFLLELNHVRSTLGITSRVFVHPLAVVVSEDHRNQEAARLNRIGSTQKGSGAAQAEKVLRVEGILAKDHPILSDYTIDVGMYNAIVDNCQSLLVEGHQGFSLGLNAGFYPYCTYRDCHAAQILSDCGIPVGMAKLVVGTCRPFPIRVANRFNDKGEMVGWSGPCYDDQEETSFEALGRPQEFTTVTKLPRRIFTFSRSQIRQAVRANDIGAPISIFANFVNYLPSEKQAGWLSQLAEFAPVGWYGTGPTEDDVHSHASVEV